MEEVCEAKDFSFPREEEKILSFWKDSHTFQKQLEQTKNFPEYVFYDGPPFATGLPHYGHILAGTIKDIVTRYKSMTGHHVTRRFGWDCHGLPVENLINKKLGVTLKADVLDIGIDVYNEECRAIVSLYADEWEKIVSRTGRWIDFKNGYKTMDLSFMETVWWVFSQLYKKGLVYQAFKVVPYCTVCKTSLSNFEADNKDNKKPICDPEAMVAFPIVDDPDKAAFVAWTMTPWSLPCNLALCVNPGLDYVKVRNQYSGKTYVVAECQLSKLPSEKPKSPPTNGCLSQIPSPPSNELPEDSQNSYQVLSKFSGASMVGMKYEPLFEYFSEYADVAFKVVADDSVNDKSGTGIVHYAPQFGEHDHRVCLKYQIINKGEDLNVPVDEDGCYTSKISSFTGRHIEDVNDQIIEVVKEKGRLIGSGKVMHQRGVCPRSDTPLIQRAVTSWFVRVEELKEQLLQNNHQTYWVPDYIKNGRFHNWLENARDWAVSRSRFWGTPLPVWISGDGQEVKVIESIDELERLSGVKVFDLHRHNIDHITIPSSCGRGLLHRVDDVFDCWFESGSMPYAYIHYPFENVELFKRGFPGDFVAEGLDQTRGWFYTLMVLSTALFGKPAFMNVICNGLVLGVDGKKMSKRLNNYPPPEEAINEHGADALRLYLVGSPAVHAENLTFRKEGVGAVVKDVFLPLYNAYRFLVQSANRLQNEGQKPFVPVDLATLQKSANVLDHWINSETCSLVRFVRKEMDKYQLNKVVQKLLAFVDKITNVYVRMNRKRLKGQTGEEDCRLALSTLYNVLLTTCKVMAPFIPFFTEVLYQNMKSIHPEPEESIHLCTFPLEEGELDERIEQSVARMMKVVDLVRYIRDRYKRPLKTPIREMVVVHPDTDFLDDIGGKLREYVLDELNVKSLKQSNNTSKYMSLRAEPDFGILGKRLGKDMGFVAKELKAMSEEDIVAFEKAGEMTVGGHCLKLSDIKVIREFKQTNGMTGKEVTFAGDGDTLVIIDLQFDESLFAAGVAREVTSRIQKLRKKAGLQPNDAVEVFWESDRDESVLRTIMYSQGDYIRDATRSPLLHSSNMQPDAEMLVVEYYKDVRGLSFQLTINRVSKRANSITGSVSEESVA